MDKHIIFWNCADALCKKNYPKSACACQNHSLPKSARFYRDTVYIICGEPSLLVTYSTYYTHFIYLFTQWLQQKTKNN